MTKLPKSSKLAFINPIDVVRDWDDTPDVAHFELCCLIAKLDHPLEIGETNAIEEYIQHPHSPCFSKVSRQTTTRDLAKLFSEHHDKLKECLLYGVSFVGLAYDFWSSNAKEDSISVVVYVIIINWEIQKRIICLGLTEVSRSSINIAKRITIVVEECGMVDKVFSITLDNASSNVSAMDILDSLRLHQ